MFSHNLSCETRNPPPVAGLIMRRIFVHEKLLHVLLSAIFYLVVSNIFGIFTPILGVSWSDLRSIFFRWVGSTTHQFFLETAPFPAPAKQPMKQHETKPTNQPTTCLAQYWFTWKPWWETPTPESPKNSRSWFLRWTITRWWFQKYYFHPYLGKILITVLFFNLGVGWSDPLDSSMKIDK